VRCPASHQGVAMLGVGAGALLGVAGVALYGGPLGGRPHGCGARLLPANITERVGTHTVAETHATFIVLPITPLLHLSSPLGVGTVSHIGVPAGRRLIRYEAAICIWTLHLIPRSMPVTLAAVHRGALVALGGAPWCRSRGGPMLPSSVEVHVTKTALALAYVHCLGDT